MTQDTPKGRPLDAELTARVLAAVRADLDEFGFMNLRIEKIAADLGCGKTAIYRRWPTKPALAAAAILDASPSARCRIRETSSTTSSPTRGRTSTTSAVRARTATACCSRCSTWTSCR